MKLGLVEQGATTVKSVIELAWRWWWREFQYLAPRRIMRFFERSTRRSISLSDDANRIEIREAGSPPIYLALDEGHPRNLHEYMAYERRGGRRAEFGVSVVAEKAFRRSFPIPVSARKALADVLARDLVHSTPFLPENVFHDYMVEPNAVDGRLRVQHVVILRDIAILACEGVGLSLEDADYMDVEFPDGSSFALRLRAQQRVRLLKPGEAVAAVAAAILFLCAATFHEWKRAAALGTLTADVAVMRPQVEAARVAAVRRSRQMEVFSKLDKWRQEPGVTEILERLTMALPDDCWIQNLRIADDAHGGHRLSIAGYGKDAAGLVARLDASSGFKDAAITSAVAFDPIEKLERFSLETVVVARIAGAGVAE